MKYEIRKFNESNAFAMLPIKIKRPQLIGSEKQIAWANDIIDNVIKIHAEVEFHRGAKNEVKDGGLYALRLPKGVDVNDPRMEATLDKFTEKFQAAYDKFFSSKSASFYIEKLGNVKSTTPKETLQAKIVS